MNTKDKNSYEDEVLIDAYEQISPADSWQALRTRIVNRIAESKVHSTQLRDQSSLRFWKRFSFAMAASFIITAGILVYTVGLNQGAGLYQKQHMTADGSMVVGQDDMNTLVDAFSQVRQLFGEQSRWIVIGSDNDSQVGITEYAQTAPESQKLVVVRLAISSNRQGAERRYYDVVTYADQKADLRLPLANASGLMVAVKPVIKSDGTISVEIDAHVNGISQSKSRCAIASDSFTPLVNMQVNGDWIRIDGVGSVTSVAGRLI